MEVRYAQSQVGASHDEDRLPLDELLQSADVISLHCPLTLYPQPDWRAGARADEAGRPADQRRRGGLVDEEALLRALANGASAAPVSTWRASSRRLPTIR